MIPLKEVTYRIFGDRLPISSNQLDIICYFSKQLGYDPEVTSYICFGQELCDLTRAEAACLIDDLKCNPNETDDEDEN